MSAYATSLPTPRPTNHRRRELFWTLAACLFLALGMATAILLRSHSQASGKSITAAAYRKELENEVDTSTGAPVSGRDPASQLQTSLATAASMQDEIGKRVAKPAAAVVGTIRHTSPTSVLPDTKATHVLASGCLLGYGVPGVQCVPVKAPNDQPLDCNFLRTIFPKGVKILGNDFMHLGQGTDTACAANVAAPPPTSK